MSAVDRIRPLAGILGGAILGGTIYAFARGLLPAQFAFGSAVVGAFSGIGARAVGAIGSPAQLRVLIFGSLFATVVGEYFAFSEGIGVPSANFPAHLLQDPAWLAFTVVFLVAGIFLGVRVLVGGDPLSDVLEHGGDVLTMGAAGTPCPRCESLQTQPDQSKTMTCTACGHRWRVPPPN
jgi:hypothetical protein